MNMETGEKQDLTSDFDYSTDELAWSPDGKSLYIRSAYQGEIHIFKVGLDKKSNKSRPDITIMPHWLP